MTEDEIRGLLAAAMAYDNRRPGDANVAAWMESARRERWTFADALEAIHAHYARSAQFVMPGHVTELIRQERRQPAPVAGLLEPASPASEETRAQMKAFIGEHFALPKEVRKMARDGDQG